MKTNETEKITLMLPEKILPDLDYAAELSNVSRSEVVNLLLEKVHFQIFSRGKVKTKVLISEDNMDYVFGHAAREGLSPEEAVNKAVRHLIDLHENVPEEDYYYDDFLEVYGFDPDEKVPSFEESLESSWKGANLDGEKLVPVESELSYTAKELLSDAALLGIQANYLVDKLFGMYLLDFCSGDQEKEVEVTIAAEYVEYLQRYVLHGMSWRDTINLGLEFLHMHAVKEAKKKGLPLTENEELLESINWE